jgi:hypothetical protein
MLGYCSSCQSRPRSKSYRPRPKSHSLLNQGSRVAAVSNPEVRLPSPAPSAPRVMDIKMSSDYCNLGGSSRDILPTLLEVTFRPQSPHYYSFTAVIRGGCDGRGVSFSQKRASLGSGSLTNSLAGLNPQYARAEPMVRARGE